MTIQEIVSGFSTTPFIFAGSGITRRYYNLPDWKSLLLYFAKKVRGEDELAFRYYENQLSSDIANEDRLPMIASLIEKDYNAKWFENTGAIRSDSKEVAEQVLDGVSPFKAEIAAYIRDKSVHNENYKTEIEKFKALTKSNLSGIITTNYDNFFENACEDYKVFVGQDELMFSQIQGIAEIYKIHGSIGVPSSIVINHDDYRFFKEKGKYLAAKLMTIFMEYPIIFMGYSLSDPDILSIIEDIVACLPDNKIETLEKRFIFVEFNREKIGVEIGSHTMLVGGKLISMTKVITADFGLLYDALTIKKAAFPVKILRRFKDDLFSFVMTSEQKTTMRVAALDDKRIDENTLAITIGTMESSGKVGLVSDVDGDEWYRNIILKQLNYSADDMLNLRYPELLKQNSGKLPVWYYVSKAINEDSCKLAKEKGASSYNEIVTEKDIQRNKSAVKGRNLTEIWDEEQDNTKRVMRLMASLPEQKVNLSDLERILTGLFEKDKDYLSRVDYSARSHIRKLIRVYDYLKYKTP